MTPARVLLDTSAVIDLGLWEPGELTEADDVISTLTVAELAFGLDVADPAKRQLRTDRYYAVLRELTIVPFDLAAAHLYGTLAATVRQGGRNPRSRRMDLQIAATASTHGLPLITRNPADFAGLERFVEVVAV